MKPWVTFAAGAVVAICIHPAFSQTASPPLTYIQPVPPAGVQAVRSRLRDAGDYHGSVDGVWGPDSVSALRRFQVWGQSTQTAIQCLQENRGLQPNGQLNAGTLAAMGVPPDSMAYR